MTLLGDESLESVSQLTSCVGHAAMSGLSRVAKRDPFLWVFGARAGDAFADNAKYLFLYVSTHHPEIRPVWLSRNRRVVAELRRGGYEAHYTYSPRGLDTNRRAGVTFLTHGFDDVSMALSGGALSVMLWHGTPLKHVSWDAGFTERPLAARAAVTYAYDRLDLLTATTETTRKSFASGFRIDPGVITPTGYPRNDVFDREIPGQWIGIDPAVRERVRTLAENGDVWLYLPTFRRIGGASGIADHVDFAALDAVLADRGAVLLVKAHPFEHLALDETLSRVIRLPSKTDVYPLLPYTDGLVTDYSSILFDYLLRDRPMIFFPYDLARYRAERGFYYDYDSVTPGPIATEFEELLDEFDATLAETRNRDTENEYAAERARLRERFCSMGESRSEVVCETVFERLA